MIKDLVTKFGSDVSKQRVGLWTVVRFTADKSDAEFGAVVGKEYLFWITNKDGFTAESKQPLTKGEWFFAEEQKK